jgi:DNA-binding winged helix-turn-helix (wHTH) protein/TolB-like protein/thioredoxin-like negative regulator of GroEL
MSRPAKRLYEFGPFRLDPAEHVLLREGDPVPLRPKEFAVLLALVENHGHVLTKDELLEGVWQGQFVEEGNLNRHISTLRRVLGETPDEPQYVETVPKVGYRFVARVREIRDQSADVVIERHTIARIVTEEEEEAQGRAWSEPAVEPKALLTRGEKEKEVNRRGRLALGAVGVLLVGLTLALTLAWSSRKSRGAKTGATVRSLAVLPFKPIGAGDVDEYLGLGMADALITKLSNIREINIRPTSAVRKYGAQGQDPVSAGRELRVEAVIEGSVQRVGEQVRVTVQLVSVRDGTPLWAEKFDEQFTDIFAVQDRISEQVARALMLRLSVEERAGLHKRYTENAEAYQAYLKGRFFWSKRTGESMRKGIEYFDQAIRVDPNYALAYAGLADSYNVLSQFGDLAPYEAMPKAKAAALRALEIDDTLAEAHASLALVNKVYDWDWAGAETEFKRAIELNPNYANARHWYAMFLSAAGRHDAALAEIRSAKELDPVSLIVSTNEGWILFCARQYDSAIEQLRKTVELDPNFANTHYKLALVYEAKGMYKEAVQEFLKDYTLSGRSQETVATLQAAYSESGWEGFCRRQLNHLNKTSKEGYVSPKYFVLAYLQLGEKDRAFEWLEKAYEERSEVLLYLKVDPRFDPLRSDPRFEELLRRVRLAP